MSSSSSSSTGSSYQAATAASGLPFKGEGTCCQCGARPYYEYRGQPYCGRHSTKFAPMRTKLKANPRADQVKQLENDKHNITVEMMAAENRKRGIRGEVIVRKMQMLKNPERIDFYLSVFPNFKHQNRSDGFGCASLSPKSMSPVKHDQPGLPEAASLENFHQFNKVCM